MKLFRFILSWSRLSINMTKVKICEESKLVIDLSRIGNLKVSSFVSVSIISKIVRSKYNPTNYLDNFSRQVQFDPGTSKWPSQVWTGLKTCFLFTAVSKQTWQLSFPKDNVESLTEKLKIHFSKFVNSLFVSRRKFCKVLLLDEKHQQCSNGIWRFPFLIFTFQYCVEITVKRKSKISKLRKMRQRKMRRRKMRKSRGSNYIEAIYWFQQNLICWQINLNKKENYFENKVHLHISIMEQTIFGQWVL